MIHYHIHPAFYGKFKKIEKKTSVVEYTLAGFFIVVVDYLAFVASFNFLKLDLLNSTIIAYIAGFVTGYFLNNYWVFRKTKKRPSNDLSFIKYAVLVVFNLGLTYFVLLVLQNAGVSPLLGKGVVYVFLYFWIYFVSKFWVFK